MSVMMKEKIKLYFDLYYDRLYLFAYRHIGCKETARDLVQDAFMVLLETDIRNGDDPAIVKSFLYTTVKYAACRKIRQNRYASRLQKTEQTEEVEEAKALQTIFHAELMGELHRALEALPAGSRLICKMSYLEGLRNNEIAQALDISINTVKTQKQRGLHILRDRLTPQSLWLLVFFIIK